ncbi:linear amide C-N hydrolase [Mariniflexile sp. HMF6888]|uniref:linear amide C-N hydrolase n=1 Tax=Mariniflexile sp. HMF6888 TaxID=3373086 RepID=UPI00379CBEC3
MKTIFLSIIFITISFSDVFSCSVLFYADNNVCIAGNNEDHFLPYTQIQFIPSEEGKYGRVFWGYFPKFCPEEASKQGGMNEKGLFYDGLSLSPVPIQTSSGKPTYSGNLMERILEECATVKEAINILSKYNLVNLTTGQTFIADKTGDAAIIERDTIIHKKGNWLAATNFRLSEVKKGHYPCDRYNTIRNILDTIKSPNIASISNLLNEVSQKGQGPTIYSNICDLKNNVIYLYHFHNFDKSVKLDLNKELEKGEHTYRIEEIFPENQDFIAFEQRTRKDFDELYNSRNRLYKTFEDELWKVAENIDTTLTGTDILNFYAKCTGGRKGKEYIKTLTINGNINSKVVIGTSVSDFDGTFVGYKKNTGEYYERINLDGLISIENITNGEISWSRNTYAPFSFMNDHQSEGFKLNSKIESNDMTLFEEINYLGDFTINSHDCYKILCITNRGYAIAKFIDKSDGIIRAELTVVNDANNGPTKKWSTFENYYNKMYLPNKIRTEITKQTPYAIETSVYIIDFDYIVNVPIDENLFSLPKGLLTEK